MTNSTSLKQVPLLDKWSPRRAIPKPGKNAVTRNSHVAAERSNGITRDEIHRGGLQLLPTACSVWMEGSDIWRAGWATSESRYVLMCSILTVKQRDFGVLAASGTAPIIDT